VTGLRIDDIDGGSDMADALAIRREVFCVEQGVPEHEDMDGLDGAARHFLVRRNGRAIGTARVRRLEERVYKVERVAVRLPERRSGVGRALMLRLIDEIARADGDRIVLNAQLAVRDFYAGLGFTAEGGIFEEAGIPHIKMSLRVPGAKPRPNITDS
jgi:predicted GNAT family N-acyltransferase